MPSDGGEERNVFVHATRLERPKHHKDQHPNIERVPLATQMALVLEGPVSYQIHFERQKRSKEE